MTSERIRPVTGFAYLDESPTVVALAHRGGAGHPELTGLENSLAAFRHAAELGYTYLETDVQVTRDGVLLAFHDAVLDRVTDRVGAVGTLRYAEIRRALIGGREPVPTLAELFDALPHARFNVDLKGPGTAVALARFLEIREVHDRVLVGSFSTRRLREFRALTGGRVSTSAGPAEIAAYRLAPAARLASYVGGRGPVALQVPHRHRGVTVATRGLVRRAHAAGLHVHVWTVDAAAEMHTLLDRGVDGLITDRTDVLREVLTSRGLWH